MTDARTAYQDALDTRLAEDNPRRDAICEVAALRELGVCLSDVLFVLRGMNIGWDQSAIKKAQRHLDRAMELVGKP